MFKTITQLTAHSEVMTPFETQLRDGVTWAPVPGSCVLRWVEGRGSEAVPAAINFKNQWVLIRQGFQFPSGLSGSPHLLRKLCIENFLDT